LADHLAAGDHIGVHHLIRYHWAVAVLTEQPPRRLLDVACGVGYGTRLLAEALPGTAVTGVDLDPEGIRQARASPHPANASFRVGDLERWESTIGADTFDCVVSFDTIEHLAHREIMLMNLVEHLDPDGCLLLSTPVRGDGPRLETQGRYQHRIEYSPQTLYDLLCRYFAEVQRPDNGSLPHTEVFDQLEGSTVNYLLRMNPLLCRGPLRVQSTPKSPPGVSPPRR
jgi:SAM-dependent methyltransferase